MKRLLGCLLIVMIGLTACQGPMGPVGPPGKNGIDGIDGKNAAPTEWYIETFRIFLKDWKRAGALNEIGSYYYFIFDVPEITEDIYYDGLVICSYLYTDDAGYDVQTVLPFTGYFIDGIGGDENRFAMYFSYSVTPTVGRFPGTIEFRVTFSDFYTGEKGPPEECNFKLTLVY